MQAENNRVETVYLNGKRFDCGNIQGYVEAIKHIASNYKFD
jgi:UTP-glucose-1-phosphate uridylyltransferase